MTSRDSVGLSSRPGLLILSGSLAALAWLLFGHFPQPGSPVQPVAIASAEPEIEEAQEVYAPAPQQLEIPGTPWIPTPPPPPAAKKNPPFEIIPVTIEKIEPESPSGDDTMLKKSPIILAALFLGQPSGKADEAPKEPAKTPDIGKIATSLTNINQNVNNLEGEITALRATLERLTDKLDGYEEQKVQVQANASTITGLESKISRLESEIERLKNTPPSEPRRSRYPEAAPEPVANRIQVINNWRERITIVVDNNSYELEPGEARMISKTTNSFEYEILSISERRRRSFLSEGETFTIRIAPPA